MELRKMKLMVAALSVMGVVLAGCPGDMPSLTCSTTADCQSTEICHPDAKVCVQKCQAAADCPDTAKNCAALGGTSADKDTLICKCSTNELCNKDRATADQVCSTAFSICTTKCSANADCGTGYTCETATGQCKKGSTTGAACTGEGQTTCAYGEFCSSSKCTAVPAPTCENYQNFTNRGELGTTGPILFAASVVGASTDTNFCGSSAPKRVKVKLSAYSSTPFPATKSELNGFFYVRVNGATVSGPSTVSESPGNYIRSGTNNERADVIVNLCVATDSQTLSLGFYFTGGNFFCYQATY